MMRLLTFVAMSAAMFVGARGIAADAMNQAPISKRQMAIQVVNCMKKRMSADRATSYNAAARVCKDQVNNQSNISVSVASATHNSPASP